MPSFQDPIRSVLSWESNQSVSGCHHAGNHAVGNGLPVGVNKSEVGDNRRRRALLPIGSQASQVSPTIGFMAGNARGKHRAMSCSTALHRSSILHTEHHLL